MNKLFAAILSCAILVCFCSCQPEPKTEPQASGTNEVLAESQPWQADDVQADLRAEDEVESAAVAVELPVTVNAEETVSTSDTEPAEIPADPVDIEVPLEEVTETEPLKDSAEQEEVENTEVENEEETAVSANKPQEQVSHPVDVFYETYDQILKKYVDKDGNVDYRRLNRKKRDLISATRLLANLNVNTLVSFKSEDKEKAFWINAHNILTLKLIIDNYPMKRIIGLTPWYPFDSIKHIPSGRKKTFFRIASFSYTLSEIERDLLEKFKDPKLCFAFSYASASSPMLRNEIYTGEKLNAQLEDQIAGFFQKPTSFMIDRQKATVGLSSVFELYEKVFLNSKYAQIRRYRDKKEDVRTYLNFLDSYISVADMKYLQNEEYKVKDINWDWSLNEKKKR